MKNLFICLFMTAFAVAGTYANGRADRSDVDPIQNEPQGDCLVNNADGGAWCSTWTVGVSEGPFTATTQVRICCGRIRNGIGCWAAAARTVPTVPENTARIPLIDLLAKLRDKISDMKSVTVVKVSNSDTQVVDGTKYAIRSADYKVVIIDGEQMVDLIMDPVK